MSSQVNQEALIANEFNKQYPYDDMNEWDGKLFKSGYQAATQASDSEINSLKQRVEELRGELDVVKSAFYVNALRFHPEKPHDEIYSFIEGCVADGKVKIVELQADNLRLREALEKTFSRPKLQNEIDEILSSTPAQSLAEHDNEVIEKCVQTVAKYANLQPIAEEIRALKVTP